MGKAAERRKAYRMKYLAKLSFDDPSRFASEWNIRLQSWLDEVRVMAKDWKAGEDRSKRRVFEVLDEANKILLQCEGSIYHKYAETTYDQICHECCAQVSRVIDPRLYRLSNMDQLLYKAKKSARV